MLYFLLNLNLGRFKSKATGNQIILTKCLQMKSTQNKTKARDIYSCARQVQYSECVAPTFNKLKMYLRIHNSHKSNIQVKEENRETTFSSLYYKESQKK